jgi:hypothetical protein
MEATSFPSGAVLPGHDRVGTPAYGTMAWDARPE